MTERAGSTKPGTARRGFAPRIIGRYTRWWLFTLDFLPLVATPRLDFLSRRLELVYALPYLILRQPALVAPGETWARLDASIETIRNIYVRLEASLSSPLAGQTYRDLRPQVGTAAKAPLPLSQLGIFRPGRPALPAPGAAAVSGGRPPAPPETEMVPYPYPASAGTAAGRSDSAAAFAGETRHLQGRPPGEGYLEKGRLAAGRPLRITGDQPLFSDYQRRARSQLSNENYLPVLKEPGTTLVTLWRGMRADGEGQVTHHLDFTGRAPGQGIPPPLAEPGRWEEKALRLSPLDLLDWGSMEPVARTYPPAGVAPPGAMPEITSNQRDTAKGMAPPPPQPLKVDVEGLTEQVYQLLERKIRIERERRGL